MTTGGSVIRTDATSITVRVPASFANRKTGKKIVPPLGAPQWAPAAPHVDNTLIRAVVRGHRWRAMLETGHYASIKELAVADKVNESYVCRLLRLTLLAPPIIESILNGK